MSQASFTTSVFCQKCPDKKSLTVPVLNTFSAGQFSFSGFFPPFFHSMIWSVHFLLHFCLDLCVCLCACDHAHLSFHPPSLPQCGLSDGPTHCCTWSKSAWQESLCSRDWQVYSWRCSLPQARTGSEARALEGPRGRFPGVRSDSGNHHRLSLWEEEKGKGNFSLEIFFPLISSSISLCFIDSLRGLTGTEVGSGRKRCILSVVYYHSVIHTSEQHCPLNWVCTRQCRSHLIANNCRVSSRWPVQSTIFFHWAIKCTFNKHLIVVSICGNLLAIRLIYKKKKKKQDSVFCFNPQQGKVLYSTTT